MKREEFCFLSFFFIFIIYVMIYKALCLLSSAAKNIQDTSNVWRFNFEPQQHI